MSSKTYINGYTVNAAIGSSKSARFDNYLAKKPPKNLHCDYDSEPTELPYFSAFAENYRSLESVLESIEAHLFSVTEEANWDQSDLKTCAIFIGSTSFLISTFEESLLNTTPETLDEQCRKQAYSLNILGDYLKVRYNNTSIFVLSTSCTSSANALLYAKQMLDQKRIDKAIVIGFELFNIATLYGFHSLGLITQNSYLPFSEKSDGLVLGEGISAIALSREIGASKHVITLEGAAALCDPYNIVTTQPAGEKVAETISQALENANLAHSDIKMIKGHGTGSIINDSAELKGIERISQTLPITFLKSYIGHTLGACGAIECALMIEHLTNGFLPALPDEYLLTPKIVAPQIITQKTDLNGGYYLLNYLGFGGNNVSLVLGFNP